MLHISTKFPENQASSFSHNPSDKQKKKTNQRYNLITTAGVSA